MVSTPTPENAFSVLDDSKATRFQYKVMFVSGMGFFCDAYDLFIIGIVVALLKTQWHLSTGQVALLSSLTLVASALGAVVFGRIADKFGRKRIYGYEVIVLAIGAIASACSPNLTCLLISRIVLGIGIGGDYPVSATIMSEYSGKRSRGRMVGLVFAMQGAGLVAGPLLASALLLAHVPNAVTWRLLLAFGAVPALLVFSWRRKIHETPRFSEAQGNEKAVSAAIKNAVEVSPASPPSETGAIQVNPESDAVHGMGDLLKNKRLLVWLLGTASTWALLDFAYYGNTISSPEVLKLVNPNGTLVENTLVQLAIFVVFALPGYWLAVRYLDRLGRKSIQLIGFFMMAVVFLLIGLVPAATTVAIPFVLLFGLSYFFSEFGPNTTTFVFPSEIFPVRVRTTADGISAAAGKFGGFLGAFIFPIFLASTLGLRGTEVITGAVCVVGFIVTLALLPEPKGLTLEQIELLAEQS